MCLVPSFQAFREEGLGIRHKVAEQPYLKSGKAAFVVLVF